MKIVALLSLLFLSPTSCLASGQSGMGEGLTIVLGIALLLFFIIHILLLSCYQKLILKNSTVSTVTIIKASILNFFVWGCAGFAILALSDSFLNIALRPFYALLNLTGPIIILILVLIIMVITALPIYTWLFARKKQ